MFKQLFNKTYLISSGMHKLVKRFPRVFIILLLLGVFSVSSWLLNQHSHRRECDPYKVYPIELEKLQPISQHNLQMMQKLEVFSDHFTTDPDIEFNPTSQSIAISTIGSISSTVLPYRSIIWHFDDGCLQTPRVVTSSTSFLEFSGNGEFFLLHDCVVNDCYSLYASTDGRLIGRFYKADFVTFPHGEVITYLETENHEHQLLSLENMQVFTNDDRTLYQGVLLFSPDYRFFITSNSDGVFTLRNASTGGKVHEFAENREYAPGFIELMQFGPDSRWLISKRRAGPLNVWNIETGEIQLTLTEESVWLDKWAFWGDGQKLAYGHYIWNLETHSPSLFLDGSTFEVLSLDESFFSTINGKTVQFWNGLTNEVFFSLDFAETVSDVSISEDQKLIAITTVRETADENIGAVELWGIPAVYDTLEEE